MATKKKAAKKAAKSTAKSAAKKAPAGGGDLESRVSRLERKVRELAKILGPGGTPISKSSGGSTGGT
jgi:uncharacterized protein YceH (UPF0502 family)